MDERSFFFNDTATTEIYTLSLHDALPIFNCILCVQNTYYIFIISDSSKTCNGVCLFCLERNRSSEVSSQDRKSTRLNSSHANISYAVFCLKKKKLSTCSYFPFSESTIMMS